MVDLCCYSDWVTKNILYRYRHKGLFNIVFNVVFYVVHYVVHYVVQRCTAAASVVSVEITATSRTFAGSNFALYVSLVTMLHVKSSGCSTMLDFVLWTTVQSIYSHTYEWLPRSDVKWLGKSSGL